MKEVLVSGCRDNQYSYDARIDGTYHGAMTYFALRTIEEANYDLTLRGAVGHARRAARDRGLRPGAAGRGQDGEQAPPSVHVSV